MLFSPYHMRQTAFAITAFGFFTTFYFIYFKQILKSLHTPPLQPCNKCAYATFLSTSDINSTINERHFTAVRVLSYQVLHHLSTRTQLGIPFIVVVAPNVSAKKRKALEEEGATVIAVQDVRPETDWLKREDGHELEIDQLTKLRIFELGNYRRILYIDPSTLLTQPLDAIFSDFSVQEDLRTLAVFESDSPNQGEIYAQPPPVYLIASTSNLNSHQNHSLSRSEDLLSSTFMLIQPSSYLFVYYTLILNKQSSFDSIIVGEGLLNLVHRKNGSMPWVEFEGGLWNVREPTWDDKKKGFASLQGRFWEEDAEELVDRKLVMIWRAMEGEMERYWDTVREREQWE